MLFTLCIAVMQLSEHNSSFTGGRLLYATKLTLMYFSVDKHQNEAQEVKSESKLLLCLSDVGGLSLESGLLRIICVIFYNF